MRRLIVGSVTALAMSLSGPAFAEDMTEEIQEEEQPGSEIEIDLGGGGATIERKSGAPVFRPGDVPGSTELQPLDDPDDPIAPGSGRRRASGRRARGSLRSLRRRPPSEIGRSLRRFRRVRRRPAAAQVQEALPPLCASNRVA